MNNASGKLVIVGILVVAFAAAGMSWWFRYSATHRAAEYWGPKAARLIRDAPAVQFWPHEPPADLETVRMALISTGNIVDPAAVRDITNARGLIHLRNALLDDRSYRWPAVDPPEGANWKWVVSFRNDPANEGAMVILSDDCKLLVDFDRPRQVLSCESIAVGLSEMIADFVAEPPAASAR